MKKILTIFKKELLDTLRDRRTLVVMIVIPLLLFPLLIGISSKIMMKQRQDAAVKVLSLGLITHGNAAEFRQKLVDSKSIKPVENIGEEEIKERIRTGKMDFGLVFAQDFDQSVAQDRQGSVKFYLKSSRETELTSRRIEKILDAFEADLVAARFKKLDLDQAVTKAIAIDRQDIATAQEKIGEAVGGLLPYLFVIFCFMGAMYPAIDLGAGEKERGTIETLLTSPARRLQIVIGKFGVVFLAGIASVAISFVGLYLAIRSIKEIPDELFDLLTGILSAQTIFLVLSLIVPLTIFFAGVLLTLSIFAHTFKEAQSIITPLNLVVIIPVFIGLFPGFKLNSVTALIPILNVSLATREIISGTIKAGLLIEVYLSLIVLAFIGLLLCTRWFQREDVIFRGT
jgi:sodium transport system permease protein